MTAIERAEALLTIADTGGGCTGVKGGRDRYPSCCAGAAASAIMDKGAEFLRGYIGAIKALAEGRENHSLDCAAQHAHWRESGIDVDCPPCEAIADFERLFPETPASAD